MSNKSGFNIPISQTKPPPTEPPINEWTLLIPNLSIAWLKALATSPKTSSSTKSFFSLPKQFPGILNDKTENLLVSISFPLPTKSFHQPSFPETFELPVRE